MGSAQTTTLNIILSIILFFFNDFIGVDYLWLLFTQTVEKDLNKNNGTHHAIKRSEY